MGPENESTKPSRLQRLYTVVMDFEGTACATQFFADSVQHALQLWLDDLSLTGIYGLDNDQRTGLLKAIAANHWKFTKLDELKNIWWVTITAEDGGVALLHIVESVMQMVAPEG